MLQRRIFITGAEPGLHSNTPRLGGCITQKQHTCYQQPWVQLSAFQRIFLFMLLRFIDGTAQNRGLKMSIKAIQYWLVASQYNNKTSRDYLELTTLRLDPSLSIVQADFLSRLLQTNKHNKKVFCYNNILDFFSLMLILLSNRCSSLAPPSKNIERQKKRIFSHPL